MLVSCSVIDSNLRQMSSDALRIFQSMANGSFLSDYRVVKMLRFRDILTSCKINVGIQTYAVRSSAIHSILLASFTFFSRRMDILFELSECVHSISFRTFLHFRHTVTKNATYNNDTLLSVIIMGKGKERDAGTYFLFVYRNYAVH